MLKQFVPCKDQAICERQIVFEIFSWKSLIQLVIWETNKFVNFSKFTTWLVKWIRGTQRFHKSIDYIMMPSSCGNFFYLCGGGGGGGGMMACFLAAPSHYINQCWLAINTILRNTLQGFYVRIFFIPIMKNWKLYFWNHTFRKEPMNKNIHTTS